jgi:hypothetical protein
MYAFCQQFVFPLLATMGVVGVLTVLWRDVVGMMGP